MTPNPTGRTQDCNRDHARVRLTQARTFLDVAELVSEDADDLATPGVAASLAVLAGIAAADAVCCIALGQRSRGQDHRQAVQLVETVGADGRQPARALDRLLDIKDGAHYGMVYVGTARSRSAIRQATVLRDAAERLVR